MFNLMDFEAVAASVMKKEAWDYYSSGADDEISVRENRAAFQRLWLRPRIMRDVSQLNLRTTMLGTSVALPVYISASALGKLAHPDGEVALARAANVQDIIQMVPTLASCSLDEIFAVKQPQQTMWFQLYSHSDTRLCEELVRRAEAGGCTALAITVDTPHVGRRERDMRNKFTVSNSSAVLRQTPEKVNQGGGAAVALSSFINPSLTWEHIKWFRSITKMKIVLKGVQTGEDAILAWKYGADAIIVSNHGGRQLDTARSSIEILPEVMAALRFIGADRQLEVFLDGGIRRGTDIFKALALGARAVGLSRPALWGLAGYGQAGVERVIDMLKYEFETCMAMMGCASIADITQDMVMTSSLSAHSHIPIDYLAQSNYAPLTPVALPSRM
jgi:L-lactate dehydrogenase (cytochrome)